MRTDYRGGADGETHGFNRPIWEERDTAEQMAIIAPPPVPAPGVRAPSAYNGAGVTNWAVGHDDAVGYQDPAETGESSEEATGRHHASHKAPRGRGKGAGLAQRAEPVDTAPRTHGDLIRTGIRGLGQTLITFGIIVLLFVVYELFITDLVNAQTQENLTQELEQNWADDPTLGPNLPNGGLAQVPLGDGIGLIRIPAFGTDYVRVVVQGTDTEQLAQGPGHYLDSAMPGELGNFALAGHRVSQGSPFLDLDKLKPGDAIVIETSDTYFTYRVLGDPQTGNFAADPSGISGQEIVSPSDVGVVYPIPGVNDSTIAPTNAYLTLTTCNPKFSAQQRLIIHAVLEGPGLPKAQYPDGPPAMTGG